MGIGPLGYSLIYIGLGAFTGFVLGAIYGINIGKTSGKLEGWVKANGEMLENIRLRKSELARPMQKHLVMVVEDNDDARALMASSLELYGYRVIRASTGVEAINALSQKPRSIIIDINLPDISGIDLAKQLRALADEVNLIAVTGYVITDEILESVDAAMQKPYDLFQLIQAIEK